MLPGRAMTRVLPVSSSIVWPASASPIETVLPLAESLDGYLDPCFQEVYLEGEIETEIVRILLRRQDILSRERGGHELSSQAEAARAEIINLVNNFYYEKLTGVPQIQEYIEKLADAG
jgi:hypothetical protein